MTVRELIEALSKQDPDAPVEVSVSYPKDSAWSRELQVENKDGLVCLSGWVSSDDDTAFFPID